MTTSVADVVVNVVELTRLILMMPVAMLLDKTCQKTQVPAAATLFTKPIYAVELLSRVKSAAPPFVFTVIVLVVVLENSYFQPLSKVVAFGSTIENPAAVPVNT